MSIAPRAHQCSRRPRTWAGQSGFKQRQTDAFLFVAGVSLRDLGAAFGAGRRETERFPFAAAALGQHDVHDGGNDFAGFFDGHGVADADVFLADVILVMQRGAADGAAGQEDRFEFGHGRERAGAAHLDGDAVEPRLGLLGGVFVGDGPARRLGGEAGDVALREGVQLDDRAVGLVGEVLAHLVQLPDGGDQFIRRAAVPGALRRLEAEPTSARPACRHVGPVDARPPSTCPRP